MISCDTVQSRTHAFLDGEVEPAEHLGVQAHLLGCPGCATSVAESLLAVSVVAEGSGRGVIPEGVALLDQPSGRSTFAPEPAPVPDVPTDGAVVLEARPAPALGGASREAGPVEVAVSAPPAASSPAAPAEPLVSTTPEDADSLPEAPHAVLGTEAGPELVGTRLGGYHIAAHLATGGMGTVYRATQLSMARDVALKILSPRLAAKPDYVKRFLREARAAAALEHSNIVRIFDIGEGNGYFYYSMQYVPGDTVEDAIRRQGALRPDWVIDIGVACAKALVCASRQGIVHRDIKPANILLGNDGVVRLADMGLAKFIGDEGDGTGTGSGSLTTTGGALGSPNYMSPERARDPRSADLVSDIYSLGATLYHAVTGKVPHWAPVAVEVIARVLKEDLLGPADPNREAVPPALRATIERMVARDRTVRMQSAAEVEAALVALQGADLSVGPVAPDPFAAAPPQGRAVVAPRTVGASASPSAPAPVASAAPPGRPVVAPAGVASPAASPRAARRAPVASKRRSGRSPASSGSTRAAGSARDARQPAAGGVDMKRGILVMAGVAAGVLVIAGLGFALLGGGGTPPVEDRGEDTELAALRERQAERARAAVAGSRGGSRPERVVPGAGQDDPWSSSGSSSSTGGGSTTTTDDDAPSSPGASAGFDDPPEDPPEPGVGVDDLGDDPGSGASEVTPVDPPEPTPGAGEPTVEPVTPDPVTPEPGVGEGGGGEVGPGVEAPAVPEPTAEPREAIVARHIDEAATMLREALDRGEETTAARERITTIAEEPEAKANAEWAAAVAGMLEAADAVEGARSKAWDVLVALDGSRKAQVFRLRSDDPLERREAKGRVMGTVDRPSPALVVQAGRSEMVQVRAVDLHPDELLARAAIEGDAAKRLKPLLHLFDDQATPVEKVLAELDGQGDAIDDADRRWRGALRAFLGLMRPAGGGELVAGGEKGAGDGGVGGDPGGEGGGGVAAGPAEGEGEATPAVDPDGEEAVLAKLGTPNVRRLEDGRVEIIYDFTTEAQRGDWRIQKGPGTENRMLRDWLDRNSGDIPAPFEDAWDVQKERVLGAGWDRFVWRHGLAAGQKFELEVIARAIDEGKNVGVSIFDGQGREPLICIAGFELKPIWGGMGRGGGGNRGPGGMWRQWIDELNERIEPFREASNVIVKQTGNEFLEIEEVRRKDARPRSTYKILIEGEVDEEGKANLLFSPDGKRGRSAVKATLEDGIEGGSIGLTTFGKRVVFEKITITGRVAPGTAGAAGDGDGDGGNRRRDGGGQGDGDGGRGGGEGAGAGGD